MSATASSTLQVYLIEDDPDHALIIGRAIRAAGPQAEVRTAEDGEGALAALRAAATLPDLILLDINMPGLSGFDVLAQVRADPRLALVPVVMLTSSDLVADIARAYELGASGYISKPSELADVRAVLGNTLLYWAALKRAAGDGEVA